MKFGIIGLGAIASKFTKGIHRAKGANLYAVASRDVKKAKLFAKNNHVDIAYGSYEELLEDNTVEAVYIAVPHPFHYKWSMEAIKHKKHVICEKPCGMNEQEVKEMVEAAKKAKVYFAEGFMYRMHPQTFAIIKAMNSGVIGDIKHITASFGYPFMSLEEIPERIYKKELGGGGILDVGCYPLSYTRMLVSAIEDKLTEPTEFHATGYVNEEDVDMHTDAVMKFPNGITATISCSIDSEQPNSVKIFGTKGYLSIKEPYTATANKNAAIMSCHLFDGKIKRYYEETTNLYSYEVEALIEFVGEGECPYITHQDSINNAHWLDLWQKQIRENK
ncbi:MAG: Gfo/Idh/MocA family oxidoreductase [Abditibacteriota bacterium]|nr:Gfo/Idh/MocA family oxidoreductase [Abditibacteriota bacterium]